MESKKIERSDDVMDVANTNMCDTSRVDTNVNGLGFPKRKQTSSSLKSLLFILSLASLSTTLPLVSSYAFTATTTTTSSSVSIGSTRSVFRREEWTFPRQRSSSSLQMYVPANSPTSKTPPMVAQAFYSSQHNQQQRIQTKSNKNTNMSNHQASASPLSNSVLSSQDTLPSFPTAHGLLSPETVLRMEQMVQSRKCNNPGNTASRTAEEQAIDYFLDTYRRQGPMACVPLLSDDTILPHLTNAMRDIIA